MLSSLSTLPGKILIVKLLLLYIFTITTTVEEADGHTRRRSAALIALNRSEPNFYGDMSLRIFRSVSELIFLLYCAAFSLRVWERTLGADVLKHILFQPVDDDDESKDLLSVSSFQQQLSVPTSVHTSTSPDNNTAECELVPVGTIKVNVLKSDDDDNDDDSCEEDDYDDPNVRDPAFIVATASPVVTASTTSPTTSQCSAPSSYHVLNAATNHLLLLLICLLFFTMSSNVIGSDSLTSTNTVDESMSIFLSTPLVFPLALFFLSFFSSCCRVSATARLEWNFAFYRVLLRTLWAPLYPVTFRDGFVGDILTSTVRPLQDIVWISITLVWSSSQKIYSYSWWIYSVFLPACAVSPLWYRYLQNLRQTYDSKSRWPYLGNAFKYLLAAQVGLFGVYGQERHSYFWIFSFVIATLYQVWWDIFMDWELFVRDRNDAYVYKLRTKRLYKRKWMYYAIFVTNILLRFCWTLTFVPLKSVTKSGILRDTFFLREDSGTLHHLLMGPLLAIAEILRRSLWGLLRVELEAIRIIDKHQTTNSVYSCDEADSLQNSDFISNTSDLTPSTSLNDFNKDEWKRMPTTTSSSTSAIQQLWTDKYNISENSKLQILGELCVWATAFTGLGIVAAANQH